MEKSFQHSSSGLKFSKPQPGSIEILGYIAIALFLLAYAGLVIRTNKNRKVRQVASEAPTKKKKKNI